MDAYRRETAVFRIKEKRVSLRMQSVMCGKFFSKRKKMSPFISVFLYSHIVEIFDKFRRQRCAIPFFQIKKRKRGTTLISFIGRFRLQEGFERKICSAIVIRIVSKNGLPLFRSFYGKFKTKRVVGKLMRQY